MLSRHGVPSKSSNPQALTPNCRKINAVVKKVVEAAKGTRRVVLIDTFTALEATLKELSTQQQRKKAAKVPSEPSPLNPKASVER